MNDLIRVVALVPAVMASGSLTYLVGCGIASNDSYQVSYRKHRMVLAEATHGAELVPWDDREFGHPRFITGVTSKFPISSIGSKAASNCSKVSASQTMKLVCSRRFE
ncbi:hypothetical protein N9R66_01015 [bacterium]|nr:hypothetical protein [bacterium]